MHSEIQKFLAIIIFSSLGTHQWMKHYDPVEIKISIGILTVLPSISAWWLAKSGYGTALSIVSAYSLFYIVLLASVIGYRLSPSHPLAKYPGPTVMKITKLWAAWIAYGGKTHIYMKALHDQYGSVVRIGPNELSTTEKGFVLQILGSQGMPKGPLWDGRRFAQTEAQKDYDSLIDLRDSVLHAKLRKPWNQAFSSEPLKDYELLLIPRIAQILEILKGACLSDRDGIGRVNIAKWMGCFAFDFIGDVAFGGCFELMKEGDKDGCFHDMEAALYLISITQHIPWIAKITRNLPLVNRAMARFIKFAVTKALTRYNMDMKRKDLFYHMTEASGDPESELPTIISNALLAIVAGSDTLSFNLSCVFYLLLSNPASYHRLQREVDETFEKYEILAMDTASSGDSCSPQARYSEVFGSMPFLNAVLNEGMRLFPAVPTGFQRAPAKESGGKILKTESLSVFLPEGNAITIPAYVIHRDLRYFSPNPDSFIPERWLPSSIPSEPETSNGSATEFQTARDAFIPFSAGPQNCAGRPLALMEMRYLLAVLMRNFDMEFDRKVYIDNQWEDKMEDRFTFQAKGVLPVLLKWRGGTTSSRNGTL